MQNLAFTHLNLFDGMLDSDLQEDVTLLVERKKRGKITEGTISQIAPSSAVEIPSNLLGVDQITGTLEPGKSADFLVLDGNPLDDLMALENPRHVVQRGHVIENPSYKKVKALEEHRAKRYFYKHVAPEDSTRHDR